MSLTQPQSSPDFDPASLRILVVDDEPMLRSVIQEFLEMMGFSNHLVAGDGLEALDILRVHPVDCLLSDIRMPNMELDELLPILAQEFPHLIVIATSGCNDFDSAFGIFHAGAHDFLGKPLNLEALQVALCWIIERRQVLEEARSLFGAGAAACDGAQTSLRLARLESALERETVQFRPLMAHARRVGRLAARLQPPDETALGSELAIAAYLHEMGASYQMFWLCQQPRRLDSRELHLVQSHCAIGGRLVARALDRPVLQTIIGQLGWWDGLTSESWATADGAYRLSAWLGVLNAVDGMMQTRCDRPALSLPQLREMLHRRFKSPAVEPVQCLLDRWDVMEAQYRAR